MIGRSTKRLALVLVAAASPAIQLAAAEVRLVLADAASIHGANGTFFHTDLRVFNSAYAASISVTAIYHCWGGGACAAVTRSFPIAPRQNASFDDVIASLFEAPETGGAIEFVYDDAAGPLLVGARLRTPAPPFPDCAGSVPVRRVEEARSRSVFNQVALSTDPATGYRTNAGGFNPGTSPVTAIYTLRRADGTALGSVTRTFAPGEFFQFGGTIGYAAGVTGITATDLYVTVVADGPFFPFVVVISNENGDLFFPEPGDDPAPPEAVDLVVTLSRFRFSPGGPDDPPIRLRAGTRYRLEFRALDGEHGISPIPQLGIAGRWIVPGADYVVEVTPTTSQRGSYNFACTFVCGGGHGLMHGTVVVE